MSAGDWKQMFYAVQKNDLALVKYYCRIGIDVNYQHPEIMTTFLIESIRNGHLEISQFLLENGAIADLKEDFGDGTPLSIAKQYKNKKAIEMLEFYLKK